MNAETGVSRSAGISRTTGFISSLMEVMVSLSNLTATEKKSPAVYHSGAQFYPDRMRAVSESRCQRNRYQKR